MPHACLNCGTRETHVPLVTLQFREKQYFICTRCFPILIHSPAKLAHKLEGAEHFPSANHDH